MPIKTYNPTTPSRRYITNVDFSMLTKKEPEKSLLKTLTHHAGRNSRGKITVRHRGAGCKQLYRMIDFKQNMYDIEGEIKALEYDPYRTAFIILVEYKGGIKKYILAPENVKVGDKIVSSLNKVEAKTGNRMPLKYIPVGSLVHNIEFEPQHGGQIVKSAGSFAQYLAAEDEYVLLKFPSGELRKVSSSCSATIGRVSNTDHENICMGSAGRVRKMGIRPAVRGKAMNPKDHPHGGGEGRNSIGLIHPKTRWGKPALGVPTRKKKKRSNRLIVERRK